MKRLLAIGFVVQFSLAILSAQGNYWQQEADYTIGVDYAIEDDTYVGAQTIKYTNHSPDTLDKLYFHLYYNAFQPDSDMDHFVRNMPDPGRGLDWKLKYLTSSESGKMQVEQILQDSKLTRIIERGTILEVETATPIEPGRTTELKVSFQAQTPLMARRAGKDNAEGIELSMAQWYPKLCVYNEEGWQLTPYVGREFHADFGNYDVQIRIDSSYILAAGADSYSVSEIENSSKRLWHFKSDNVIDFAWAADPDYKHYAVKTDDGVMLHFYYQEEQNKEKRWKKMSGPLKKIFPYISKRFGKYPYSSFHFIQAGDGGMEYPKSTFITGERSLGSLIGVSIHEIMHSWYQGVIASQENLYAWMDEGFASYATTEIKKYMADEGIHFKASNEFEYKQVYDSYEYLAKSGYEEPMCTPANFFFSNTAFNIASYNKGQIFLTQLEYIIGKDNLDQTLLNYYQQWKFKHPTPEDFIRVAEKTSDIKLDWYLHFWTKTTQIIDYDLVVEENEAEITTIRILKKGMIPMPVDLEVEYKDGSNVTFIIPLDIMFGQKPTTNYGNEITLKPWSWAVSEYDIQLNTSLNGIKKISIDPSQRMADVNKLGNAWVNKDVK